MIFELVYAYAVMRSALWKICVCSYVGLMPKLFTDSSIEFRIVSVVSTHEVPSHIYAQCRPTLSELLENISLNALLTQFVVTEVNVKFIFEEQNGVLLIYGGEGSLFLLI